MSPDIVPISVEVGNPIAEHAKTNHFIFDFEGLLLRAKLKIIIFGPNESAGELYTKRCQIRDKLLSIGHDVRFGEDFRRPDGVNLTAAELIALYQYDYVVCMMCSPGTIGEVHDFCKIKRIAQKMMICVDENNKNGYSAQGDLRIFEGYHGKLDWYVFPTDIRDCHLMTRIVEHIGKVSESKQWEIINGGIPV